MIAQLWHKGEVLPEFLLQAFGGRLAYFVCGIWDLDHHGEWSSHRLCGMVSCWTNIHSFGGVYSHYQDCRKWSIWIRM